MPDILGFEDRIVDEILMSDSSWLDDYLAHVGVGHLDGGHSGRYPWGSGETPFQHTKLFYDIVKQKEQKAISHGPTQEQGLYILVILQSPSILD